MSCDIVREQMLEADLADLRGQTDSVVSRHLRGCVECQHMARAIVEGEDTLASALTLMTEGRPSNGARVRRSRGYWTTVLPLAAAASLVVLLLRGRTEPPAPVVHEHVEEPIPFVEVSGNTNVAVFNTNDPNIVVVWFFGGME